MSCTTLLTSGARSTTACVVTSPARTTRPVVVRVSQATRELGSWPSMASRTASEIWSHILSGWPIETDSDVNTERLAIGVRTPRASPAPGGARGERARRLRDGAGPGNRLLRDAAVVTPFAFGSLRAALRAAAVVTPFASGSLRAALRAAGVRAFD